MGDENIQRAPILHAIQHQARKHAVCPPKGFVLSILICPIGAVADRTAEAADQKLLMADQLEVQIGTAFDASKVIVGVVVRVMIAGHIHQWLVQKGEQVFEIGIRQVTASQDQFHVTEMPTLTKAVKPLDDFIAYRKDFHKELLCLRKPVPAREKPHSSTWG